MGWAGIAAIGAVAVALGQCVHGARPTLLPAKAASACARRVTASTASGTANSGAPALAGLQPWYVQRQLHNFAAGVRGTSERDKAGQQMRPMARALEGPQAVAERRCIYRHASASPA